jgi:hypothetical protein
MRDDKLSDHASVRSAVRIFVASRKVIRVGSAHSIQFQDLKRLCSTPPESTVLQWRSWWLLGVGLLGVPESRTP